MSERLNRCPNCGATQYIDFIIKAHNPDTLDSNMRATLKCGGIAPEVIWDGKILHNSYPISGCEYEWEGLVTSPIYNRLRERGQII